MINLEKELKQQKKEFITKNTSVEEMKLLLTADATEDKRIINNLVPNSNLINRENEYSKVLELENLDKKYGETFHIDSIKNLCVDYKLKFLPSSLFVGDLTVETLAKIKEFSKDYNVGIDNYQLKSNFYIMAPPYMFNLEKRPKVQKDPVLFYKIDANHYRMVHKWGKDFTIARRIRGWRNSNFLNRVIHDSLIFSALLNSLWWLTLDKFNILEKWGTLPIFLLILPFIISLAYNFIICIDSRAEEFVEENFTPHNFDSKYN